MPKEDIQSWLATKVLELLERADLTVERAERLGIDNLYDQLTILRRQGFKIENIAYKTFRLIEEPEDVVKIRKILRKHNIETEINYERVNGSIRISIDKVLPVDILEEVVESTGILGESNDG